MVRVWFLVAVVGLSLACNLSGAEPATGVAPGTQPGITFEVPDGYFVSNEFEADKAESFVVLRDQKGFDAVFGAGFVMQDKAHRLGADAFATKMVVAAIKRGKALWKFKVTEVAAEGKTLTVRYTATAVPSATAEFSCPLIVALPKGDFAAVVFEENGKVVRTVEVK